MQEHKQIQLYVGLEEGGCVDVGAIKLDGFTLIATSELEALKAERDALAAWVNDACTLFNRIEGSEEAVINSDVKHIIDSELMYGISDFVEHNKPQQCLREIKAEAIRTGLDALGAPVTKFGNKSDDFVAGFNFCAVLLQQHADKVRQGGA